MGLDVAGVEILWLLKSVDETVTNGARLLTVPPKI